MPTTRILFPWSKSYLDFLRLSRNLGTYGGTLEEAERGRLDGGRTFDELVLARFVGKSCEDWPFSFSFKDRAVMDFTVVPLDCDGFMSNFGFLMNEKWWYVVSLSVGFEEISNLDHCCNEFEVVLKRARNCPFEMKLPSFKIWTVFMWKQIGGFESLKLILKP